MKENVHPEWYPEAEVICACGNSWKVGATVPTMRTDVCSECHPFFTGEQRIVDTEGQVDRFMRRLRARDESLRDEEARRAAQTSPALPIAEVGLGARIESLLSDAGITTVGEVLDLLQEQGDDGLTEIKGFGLKALADTKRGLRSRGYVLPGDETSEEAAEAPDTETEETEAARAA